MKPVCEIPLTMLVARLDLEDGGRAGLFGFWYFGKAWPPSTKSGRQQYFWDFMAGKSIQLQLAGSRDQINELLLTAAAMSEDPEAVGVRVLRAIEVTRGAIDSSFHFDDLLKPKGTFLSVTMVVPVLAEESALMAQLRNPPDIVELELSPTWLPSDDLMRDHD